MSIESGRTAGLSDNGEFFPIESMYRQVEEASAAKDYRNALHALKVMKSAHAGQFRKGKGQIPYIYHPLLMACHALALGIDSDRLISTILLHDVLEDTDVTEDGLGVSEDIREAVRLLTRNRPGNMSEDEYLALYFKNIAGNGTATIVKLLDRCNNLSAMTTGFTKAKMAEYIAESEKYVLPLLDVVDEKYGEYRSAAFALEYQMKSIIQTVSNLL